MKKLFLSAIIIFISLNFLMAQFTTVAYDFERNWFNEGQPLPAEKSMVFKGMIPTDAKLIELNILSAKRKDELYTATWYKTNNNELSLIVPYKLKSSTAYSFSLNFFNALPTGEHSKLEKDICDMLYTYIEVNLSGEKSIKFEKKNKKILKEMNDMIANMLAEYRTKQPDWQPMMSELVTLKIEQLEKADLTQDFEKADSTMTKKSIRNTTRQQLVDDLKGQINREIAQLLNRELFILKDTRFVPDYATEDKENGLALNVGYGGVYLSGKWSDFTYGASPYLGIAFPLGNSVLGSKFLSNSSVTLGVFLDNFEDENGNKVSGLIVNRPIYLGLDHKLFKFIRINGGATFLEGLNASDDPNIETTKKIMIRPYLGLSARIDLSIHLGK